MNAHLEMDALLAIRDGDRSEPRFAEARRHLVGCAQCQIEVDRLHQRTARLRSLALLMPSRSQFPSVRERLVVESRQRQRRFIAWTGLAVAASIALAVVGRDLVRPTRLDAEQQLQTAMTRSQQLEYTLDELHPDQRAVDGRTAMMVIELEDRIAVLDAQLTESARLAGDARLHQQVQLWRQRVGLMNALVDVHVTRASNVDF